MFLVLFLGAWVAACASISMPRGESSSQGISEATALSQIEQQLTSGHFEAALEGANQFQAAHPFSLRSQKVRFFKGRALEELGRWSEAEQTYRAISVISEKNQPEISALALYRLSYVYEALGDNQRVLTSLFEAGKYAPFLPPEVTNAEIPSRLAMVYAKENNAAEARKWLVQADLGLRKTFDSRKEPLTEAWLAQTYYNMGAISTEQLSNDNIMTVLQGQQAVQKYLIRALQYGDPVWSAKAREKLKSTYLDLWKAIEAYPEPGGYEPLVAQKIKKDEQLKLAGPFMDLLSEAELYRPGAGQKSNTYQNDFFVFTEDLRVRVGGVLATPLLTPLMSGQDKARQPLKAPVKIVPSEDPNL